MQLVLSVLIAQKIDLTDSVAHVHNQNAHAELNRLGITDMKKIFFGWIVVLGALLTMGVLWGTIASFGVFLKNLSGEFCWTRAAISGAFTTLNVVLSLSSIAAGWLTDRYGPRRVVITGVLLVGSGYMLMSQVTAIWQLYLYIGLVVGIGQSVYWAPLMATVSRWFIEKRALALGTVLIGLGLGQMTIPPVIAYITTEHGWRMAYIAMAVIVWFIGISGAILLRRNPQKLVLYTTINTKTDDTDAVPGRKEAVPLVQQSGREALRTLPFWLIMIINFAIAYALQTVLVHIVPYATDEGIPATSSVIILTVMGISGIFARFLAGIIAIRIGTRPMLLYCLILQTIMLFGLIEARGLWIFCILAGLFSFGFSGCSPLTTSMVGELFGLSSVGTIIGFASASFGLGGGIGPFFAGYIFDASSSYTLAFVAAGVILIVAIGAGYLLTTSRLSPQKAALERETLKPPALITRCRR
jgi:MFS family permease